MSMKKLWTYCGCGCGLVSRLGDDENQVAQVNRIGPWGDSFPRIRDSMDETPYVEMQLIEYGDISEEEFLENLYLISNAPKMFNIIKQIIENGLDDNLIVECNEILAEDYTNYYPKNKRNKKY